MKSIADFAESLINEEVEEIHEGKKPPPAGGANPIMPSKDPKQPDIRNIKVPDEFVTAIVEGKTKDNEYAICTASLQDKKGEKPKDEAKFKRCKTKVKSSFNEDTQSLIKRLNDLISEAREVLKALKVNENLGTSTGMLGTTMAPTGGKKKAISILDTIKKSKKKNVVK